MLCKKREKWGHSELKRANVFFSSLVCCTSQSVTHTRAQQPANVTTQFIRSKIEIVDFHMTNKWRLQWNSKTNKHHWMGNKTGSGHEARVGWRGRSSWRDFVLVHANKQICLKYGYIKQQSEWRREALIYEFINTSWHITSMAFVFIH